MSIHSDIAMLVGDLRELQSTLEWVDEWCDRGHYPPGSKRTQWQQGFLAARREVRAILDGDA